MASKRVGARGRAGGAVVLCYMIRFIIMGLIFRAEQAELQITPSQVLDPPGNSVPGTSHLATGVSTGSTI